MDDQKMSTHRDAWMETDKADKASPAGQSSDGIGSLKSSPRMDPVPAGSEGARPYRSRKERPCDLCRRRKGERSIFPCCTFYSNLVCLRVREVHHRRSGSEMSGLQRSWQRLHFPNGPYAKKPTR
ncbi:hypothetical protein IE81DRAFT_47836 [Ceraceosorus guamensis]|uniref:Uncharacterized protein n=1 Tax=Ceraceosorus guamensis TaxID=1522189 RepID=A0A316W4P7_9BASI|nr:hypothetical protein IE81DRAFT_47836 [Ceraceosorus guamensis]PWN44108.1 hypothetical protein IE81DRAFT_47836 [Ceraceosorus guamensis]